MCSAAVREDAGCCALSDVIGLSATSPIIKLPNILVALRNISVDLSIVTLPFDQKK